MKILLATQNPHKVEELRAVLPRHWEVLLPRDLGLVDPLQEDGSTLEANAAQKAEFLWSQTGIPSLADDSGLEVEALGGAPGVDSAHYAGPERSDAANRAKLRSALANELQREAQFTTVLAWTTSEGTRLVQGVVRGRIAHEERGSNGFGYDALFVPEEGDGRSFAEMRPEEKSAISHRSRAVQAWLAILQRS